MHVAGCITFAKNFVPMQKDWVILHQDQDHVVVLKPAGMAVHGRGQHTLAAWLNRDVRSSDAEPLQHIHRLDYGTRGPVMFAKTQSAQKALQAHWPLFTKIYHAWHAGEWKTASGMVAFPLAGKPCQTTFKCLGSRPWGVHGKASLVEWSLQTGRTHQIRRHAAALGHAIVGDPVYGTPPIYTGHGLHLTCTHLAWIHPITGNPLSVRVTPAKKMKRALPGAFVSHAHSPYLSLFDGS